MGSPGESRLYGTRNHNHSASLVELSPPIMHIWLNCCKALANHALPQWSARFLASAFSLFWHSLMSVSPEMTLAATSFQP